MENRISEYSDVDKVVRPGLLNYIAERRDKKHVGCDVYEIGCIVLFCFCQILGEIINFLATKRRPNKK